MALTLSLSGVVAMPAHAVTFYIKEGALNEEVDSIISDYRRGIFSAEEMQAIIDAGGVTGEAAEKMKAAIADTGNNTSSETEIKPDESAKNPETTENNAGPETAEQPKEHQHNYTRKINEDATCTEPGELLFMCDECGDSYTEVIEAAGHLYEDEVTKEPTCELDGEKTFTCTICDDTYTEVIAATGHEEIATTKEKQPTCTEPGIQNYSCKVCHKSLRQEEIPAKGHTKGEEVTVKEPTLISKGQKEARCTECNELLETSEIAIPMSYLLVDGAVIVAVLLVLTIIALFVKKGKAKYGKRKK